MPPTPENPGINNLKTELKWKKVEIRHRFLSFPLFQGAIATLLVTATVLVSLAVS